LKTFAATKSFGTSVITLLTAQNTIGVTDIFMVPEQSVRKQFAAVMSDLKPKAAKTGALGNDVMLRVIGNLLIEQPIEKLVVDPVMVSKHGDLLMSDTAMKAFRDTVLPHALVVTPNRFEAEHLSGRSVEGPTSMKDASKAIYDRNVSSIPGWTVPSSCLPEWQRVSPLLPVQCSRGRVPSSTPLTPWCSYPEKQGYHWSPFKNWVMPRR
jgi:hydroxymethylpyrimidine/phosphomethylpyrimidine kinase